MPHPKPPRDKPAIRPDKPSRRVGLDPQRAKPAIRQPDPDAQAPSPGGRRRPATSPRVIRDPHPDGDSGA